MKVNKGNTGYIHVYTGDGKGKTTAALGLALRAYGAGMKVYIAQFIKRGEFSEIKALKNLEPGIRVEQFGLGRWGGGRPSADDISSARKGLDRIKLVMLQDGYDLMILEEANVAVHHGLISEQELIDLIESRPGHLEMVITGRNASPLILEKADLVTEMRAVKHYFRDQGVPARVGIEK